MAGRWPTLVASRKIWEALGFLILTNPSKIRTVKGVSLRNAGTQGLLYLAKKCTRCGVRTGAAVPKGRLAGVALPADLQYL